MKKLAKLGETYYQLTRKELIDKLVQAFHDGAYKGWGVPDHRFDGPEQEIGEYRCKLERELS